MEKIHKTDEEWKRELTPEQYRVMRKKETEAAFTCSSQKIKNKGVYHCAACDLPLFRSGSKFESDTGWPSYYEPIKGGNIEERTDNSLGIQRIEVVCARCDSHLGHVFDDGPPPTGKRYCINSVALQFKKNKKENGLNSVAFGGGCFWCTEAVFLLLKGVVSVIPGYAGGELENPSYDQVSSGKTGHTEVVLIEYDVQVISFGELLRVFFSSHDPTSLNSQGNDVGPQYRSIIFCKNQEQLKEAERYIKELSVSGKFSKPIVTEIELLNNFYPAEDYHKKYYESHSEEGYSKLVIKPKIDKVMKEHSKLIKK